MDAKRHPRRSATDSSRFCPTPGEVRMRRSLFSVLLVSLASCSILLCAASGLHAQTFNLQTGREAVASLNGLWRFHTGDNPAWANPNFDDSQWPLLLSDESWAVQGYKGYSGSAWYRFRVTVPAGMSDLSIWLPDIMTNYEVFANGVRIGGIGKMPPNPI